MYLYYVLTYFNVGKATMYIKKMIEFLTMGKKAKEEKFSLMGEFAKKKADLLKKHHSEKDALCIAELEEILSDCFSEELVKKYLFKKLELRKKHEQEEEQLCKEKEEKYKEFCARTKKEREEFEKSLQK